MTDPVPLVIEEHPLLRASCFVTHFPAPVGHLDLAESTGQALQAGALAPADDDLRSAIRGMLRFGGYKPSGRGKPASEYLLRVASEGELARVNLAVDACNAISLHTGFPISVIDLDLATPPFRIAIAPPAATYVFNAAGQEIALSGLVCLFDGEGPCANAVRDSQRTKTRPETTRTFSVVWGVAGYEVRLAETVAEYKRLLEAAGARNEAVEPIPTR
jgi:DNA/RNA-binding domain of Phe-tRNA-synthetase-like protein